MSAQLNDPKGTEENLVVKAALLQWIVNNNPEALKIVANVFDINFLLSSVPENERDRAKASAIAAVPTPLASQAQLHTVVPTASLPTTALPTIASTAAGVAMTPHFSGSSAGLGISGDSKTRLDVARVDAAHSLRTSIPPHPIFVFAGACPDEVSEELSATIKALKSTESEGSRRAARAQGNL